MPAAREQQSSSVWARCWGFGVWGWGLGVGGWGFGFWGLGFGVLLTGDASVCDGGNKKGTCEGEGGGGGGEERQKDLVRGGGGGVDER